MAFLIGSTTIHETDKAQQLPAASVGTHGCWLKTPLGNKGIIYIASLEGGVYGDKTIDTNKGRLELSPGQRTAAMHPSDLDELYVKGLKDDVISWVIS